MKIFAFICIVGFAITVNASGEKQGQEAIARIAAAYPEIKIQPGLFGEATAAPRIGIYLPEAEFNRISPADLAAIKWYMGFLALEAKAQPERFMTIPASAPFFSRARANVAGMTQDSWFIGEGRIEAGKLFLVRERFSGSKQATIAKPGET